MARFRFIPDLSKFPWILTDIRFSWRCLHESSLLGQTLSQPYILFESCNRISVLIRHYDTFRIFMDPMSKTLQYAATSPQSCRFSHVKSLRVRVGLLSTVYTKESLISLLSILLFYSIYCYYYYYIVMKLR